MLTSKTIEDADWGATVKKKPGPRSVNVFNINAFQGAEATAPPTPIQHTVYQLTDAKVNAQPTPDGYEAPVDHANFLIPWATAADKKRKRDQFGDDDSDVYSSDKGEDDEDEDDEDSS